MSCTCRRLLCSAYPAQHLTNLESPRAISSARTTPPDPPSDRPLNDLPVQVTQHVRKRRTRMGGCGVDVPVLPTMPALVPSRGPVTLNWGGRGAGVPGDRRGIIEPRYYWTLSGTVYPSHTRIPSRPLGKIHTSPGAYSGYNGSRYWHEC